MLTKNVRKKILLSRSETYEYSDTYTFNALVSAIDKGRNTFTLDIDGTLVSCDLNAVKDFSETITSGLLEYDKGALLSIKSTGIFNEQDKLKSIENIESMDILDPYDVSVRLNYLSKIEDNWYDGYGKAPSSLFLKQFESLFTSFYGSGLPYPAIFPTLEGNIQLEWSLNNASVLFEVDRNSYSGALLISYFDDEEEIIDLDLRYQHF